MTGGSGKGKGKGKGKSSSSLPGPISEPDREKIEREISYLLDAVYTMTYLARFGGVSVCVSLIHILPILHDCYEISNRGQGDDERRVAKLVVVELLNEILSTAFINPLKNGHLSSLDPFISVMHELIESSLVDGHAAYLVTAPLLVDLDVKHHLGNSLREIKEIVGEAEEGRVNYLVQSVDAQVDATGNSWRRAKAYTAAWVADSSVATGVGKVTSEDIAQVADLFPYLGEGFIEALLDEFHTPEIVIDRVLTENYPSHIDELDRGMGRKETGSDGMQVALMPKDEVAHNDNVSSRKNIHDGDEFDIFRHGTLDSGKVIHGKKEMYAWFFNWVGNWRLMLRVLRIGSNKWKWCTRTNQTILTILLGLYLADRCRRRNSM
jgi:hypothetical protein